MSPKDRVIAVFGSGRIKEDHLVYMQAVHLGNLLAKSGYAVCTGGYGGVMEAALKGAAEAGGHTIGVTLNGSRSKPNGWVRKAEPMENWHARLERLIELGDGYAILDGGVGTLNEFFMVWEMANKKVHQKPMTVMGGLPARMAVLLRSEPLVEDAERPFCASSPQEAAAFFDEAFGFLL